LERSRNKKDKNKKDEKIEFVPEMDIEDFEPEELAENLVLAKKMLRKRNRDLIINASYNKYAFDEDD
jgi:AdoMet-dependent rRNA methyltransferase SPB1